jgi:dTDP-glucose 4,6-dehydratase
MQCWAFHETYGLPVVVSRGTNNIGPCQHVEKAVPLFLTNALCDEPIPLYGDGLQVRDWQYVADHCRALDLVLHEGTPGEAYTSAPTTSAPTSRC